MRKKLSRIAAFVIFHENKLSRFSCHRIIKCSDSVFSRVFLAEKKYQRRKKMGINFRELKTTIFRENKLSRILENRIFRGNKSRKFLPRYFLALKYYLSISTVFVDIASILTKMSFSRSHVLSAILMKQCFYLPK